MPSALASSSPPPEVGMRDYFDQVPSDTEMVPMSYDAGEFGHGHVEMQHDLAMESTCFGDGQAFVNHAIYHVPCLDDDAALLSGTLPLTCYSTDSSTPASNTMPVLPLETLHVLCSTYFNSCQTTCQLFGDEKRLRNVMNDCSNPLAASICSHAVQACPQFTSLLAETPAESDYSKMFYLHAKASVGKAEADGLPGSSQIQALQTTILVALYEVQHAEFGLAWLTASRAVWLTQANQLHMLDTTPPSSATDVDFPDVEEARRALWAVNNLTWLLSIGGRPMDSISAGEISTSLPRPSSNNSLAGLSLSEVLRRAAPRPLSVQEGFCTVAILGPRIVMHVRRARHASTPGKEPYNFKANHEWFSEAVRYVFNLTDTESMSRVSSNSDASRLFLDVVLKAMSIVIHEANPDDARRDDASHGVSRNIALQRSLEIARAMSQVGHMHHDIIHDAGANVAMSWATYVALQSLLRYQRQQRHTRSFNVFARYPMGHITSATMDRLRQPSTDSDYNDNNAASLVLESTESLNSVLVEWSGKSPISAFFLRHLAAESIASDKLLGERVVGLAAFTPANSWSF